MVLASTAEVKRKDIETWTSSESQNKRLLAGSKLISNLKEVEKYVQKIQDMTTY